jgi:hypothetical protein
MVKNPGYTPPNPRFTTNNETNKLKFIRSNWTIDTKQSNQWIIQKIPTKLVIYRTNFTILLCCRNRGSPGSL